MRGRPVEAPNYLDRPYVDPDAPDDPIPAADYIALIGATDVERRLIERGVRAAKLVEADKKRRLDTGARNKTLSGKYVGPTPESVLDDAGVHWRRAVTLLTAIARVGKERGITFNVEQWHYNRTRYGQEAA